MHLINELSVHIGYFTGYSINNFIICGSGHLDIGTGMCGNGHSMAITLHHRSTVCLTLHFTMINPISALLIYMHAYVMTSPHYVLCRRTP